MSNHLSRRLYEAWNRAEHCTRLLEQMGATDEREVDALSADCMRRLRESADLLHMYVGDLERCAKQPAGGVE